MTSATRLSPNFWRSWAIASRPTSKPRRVKAIPTACPVLAHQSEGAFVPAGWPAGWVNGHQKLRKGKAMFPVWFRSLSHRRTLAKLLRQAGQAQRLVVENIPSMIWMSEQQFLYLLAREYFQGIGAIVDAGIFLGSSTRTFTAGLRDRPDLDRLLEAGRPVRSYDLGLCDDYMASLINAHYGTSSKSGDSFLEILQNNIQGCEDCVQFFAGDIRDQTIDSPIEVLF